MLGTSLGSKEAIRWSCKKKKVSAEAQAPSSKIGGKGTVFILLHATETHWYLRRLCRRLPLNIKAAAVARCLDNPFFRGFKSMVFCRTTFALLHPSYKLWSLILTSEIQTIHSIHHSSNSTWAMVFSLLACVEEAQRSLPFAGKSGFCILPPVLILTVKGCYGCCHLFRTSLSRQAEGWKWLKIKSHRTATLNIKVQAHPRQTRRSHLGCASGRCVGVCMWGSICFPKHHCGHIYTSPLIDLFRWLLYNFGLLLLRFRTVFFKRLFNQKPPDLLMPWWAELHVPGSACLAIWIARCHAFARI